MAEGRIPLIPNMFVHAVIQSAAIPGTILAAKMPLAIFLLEGANGSGLVREDFIAHWCPVLRASAPARCK